jgi:hypothetical protein
MSFLRGSSSKSILGINQPGIRKSDIINFVGLASYPKDTLDSLINANDFTPLFFDESGVDPPKEQYLRVSSSLDTNNLEQLANVSYKVFINSISANFFQVRLAAYDSSLKRIKEYPAVEYDPSNNSRDPPTIDGFTLYGFGVKYPVGCEYVFLEVDVSGSGDIHFAFDYAHSQLETAFNISNEFDSPKSDVFGIDYHISIRDLSNVEKDLTNVEADISTLDNSVNTIEGNISTGKYYRRQYFYTG